MNTPGQARCAEARLRRDAVSAVVGNGVLVECGSRRVVFKGADASAFLPRLLPLLDGTSDIATLEAALGISRGNLTRLLELLRTHELLDDTHEFLDAQPGGDPTVLVAAHGRLAASILADLRAAGIPSALMEAGAMRETGADVAPPLIVAEDRDDSPGLTEVMTAGAGRAVVLRCAAGGSYVEVGPIFHGDYPACLTCLRESRRQAGWDHPSEPAGPEPRAALDLAAGLAGLEILGLLGKLPGTATWPRAVRRYHVNSMASECRLLTPYADCPACGWGARDHGVEQQVLDYEGQSEVTSLSRCAGPASATAQAVRRSATVTIHLAHLPVRKLPGVASDDHAPDGSDPGGQDRYALAALLNSAARAVQFMQPVSFEKPPGGVPPVRPPIVDFYAVTDMNPFDLPGAIFRYDHSTHSVLSVNSDDAAFQSFLSLIGATAGPSRLFIVLAGTFWTAAERLDPSLRQAHLYTGYALAELMSAAERFQMRTRPVTAWPAETPRLLELRPGQEVITAICELTTHA
ncbi:MAG: hypothetical protein JOY82_11145 [Streptosporangiaceae bacterium]|nr:hypothetical protein [Streptosporangiaceae bacterium]MBV9855054.1 hypothetical protein [Streptosporangiaceae bacterium]